MRRDIDQVFEPFHATASPGCSLAVMQDGHIAYKQGYGMADLNYDVALGPNSVFHVASVSKQFTAAAIVMLASEHKLALDDDVRKYVRELPDFGQTITLRHLIHHTSGLREQWMLLHLAGWRSDVISNIDILDLLSAQKRLNFPPGERYLYSNTGYTLLAEIVKRVSGQSFREFTTSHIFVPLGMSNTHFRDDHTEVVKHLALGYEKGNVAGQYRLCVPPFDTVGATGLLTTVEDLALWDENFYHPRLGGTALVKQMLERGKLNNGKELNYAFGLEWESYRGIRIVEHSGADWGYRADLLRFPDHHVSIACLCNLADTSATDLARKVADVVLQKYLQLPDRKNVEDLKPIYIPTDKLALYVGLYWNRTEEQALQIISSNGRLFYSRKWVDRGVQRALTAIGDDRFRTDAGTVVQFVMSLTGTPTEVISKPSAGEPVTFERESEYHPTAIDLVRFTGTYRSDEIEPLFRIYVENDELVLKRPKYRPTKLTPEIVDYFRSPLGVVHFERSSQGRIEGFVLNTGKILGMRFRKDL